MDQQVDDRSGTRTGPVAIVPIAAIVLILAVVAVVVPLVIAARGDAFGIPRSDDWSYLLTLFRFADTGRISFNNWVSMTLIGQVVLSAPVALAFGRSIRAVQVLTALVGLGGLLTVVGLGRALGVRTGKAVFVAVMVAVGPLWAALAVSYMTDIPAFTAGMVTLLLGVVALGRRPVAVGWVVAALVAGFVAFSIRQYAIVPGLATAIVAGWTLATRGDRRRLRQVAIATGVLLLAAAVLFLWWRGYSNAKSLSPAIPSPHSVWDGMLKGTEFLRLLALLVTPVLLLAHPVRLVRRSWDASRALSLVLGGLMLVLQVGVFVRVRETPFLGNYVARDGVLARAVLEGERPDVLPRALFDLLVVVASVAAVVLAVALVPFVLSLRDRWRDRRFGIDDPVGSVVVLTIVGYAAAYLLAVVTELPLYDRYVLPFVPLVAFLLLRVPFGLVPGAAGPADRSGTVAGPAAPVGAAADERTSGRGALVGAGIALGAPRDGRPRVRRRLGGVRRHPVARRPARHRRGVPRPQGERRLRVGQLPPRHLEAAERERRARGGPAPGPGPILCGRGRQPGTGAARRVIAREESTLPFRHREEFVALRTNRSCPAADERAGR